MQRERMKLENYKCWATPLNFIVFVWYKPYLRNIRSFSHNAFVRVLFFAHICLPLIFSLKTMWGMQEGRAASKHCNPLLSQRKWTTERPSLAFTSVLGLTHFCPSVLVLHFCFCVCVFSSVCLWTMERPCWYCCLWRVSFRHWDFANCASAEYCTTFPC